MAKIFRFFFFLLKKMKVVGQKCFLIFVLLSFKQNSVQAALFIYFLRNAELNVIVFVKTFLKFENSNFVSWIENVIKSLEARESDQFIKYSFQCHLIVIYCLPHKNLYACIQTFKKFKNY